MHNEPFCGKIDLTVMKRAKAVALVQYYFFSGSFTPR